YGLRALNQSRVALPYPSLEDYRLPSGERFFAYTTCGQIQDGDAIYFRDFLIDANREAFEAASPIKILKLAVLYEIYCLNDCAAELILAAREKLAAIVDCERLLDLLASGIAGRAVRYCDYVELYFAPNSGGGVPASVASLGERDLEQLRNELAAVYRSTSWRVTRPLRALPRFLRRAVPSR
ncbi:MAG: hypothetical protein ACREFL_18270, partial [Stellaceae bacterium]